MNSGSGKQGGKQKTLTSSRAAASHSSPADTRGRPWQRGTGGVRWAATGLAPDPHLLNVAGSASAAHHPWCRPRRAVGGWCANLEGPPPFRP